LQIDGLQVVDIEVSMDTTKATFRQDAPSDSPALAQQSDLYPSHYAGRVPLRVRVLKDVTSDFPIMLPLLARRNGIYDVWVNSHGAVSAFVPVDGGLTLLGLKPAEFEVVEWHTTQSSAGDAG
jgi:hypothetical protein